MKLSLQLYLTYYSESLQTCWYILKERMRHVSIYLIDGLSINSAELITVSDLFDSLEYLITLRSNISPCQKATTLIWMPLSNPSFHLWKSLKKFLGAAIFLSWLPFEICDYDKLLNYECHAILAVSGHLSK